MADMNLRAVITADDKASRTIGNVGASFSKLAGAVGVGQIAAQAFTKALDLVIDTGKMAIKQAASFEQTRIGLENMLGSADKARKLLSDINKFAAETPFEFPELAQATRQLVAFGFGAEDAFSTMKQLGDVSAAVGAPINDLAYLMGTLKTQGRAFTIDIRQFAQRGVPIYEYLAKVFKVNTEQLTELIETGKVGFPEVQQAFQLMTAEGGKFHGTMAKQSQSLTGLWSTLNDQFGMTLRHLVGITDEGDVVAGGFFDKLRNGAALLIEVLNGSNETFNNFVQRVKDGFTQIGQVILTVYTYIKPALDGLWSQIQNQLVPAFMDLIRLVAPYKNELILLVKGALTVLIVTLVNLVNTIRVVVFIITSCIRTIQLFGAAFTFAYTKAREAAGQILSAMQSVVNVLRVIFAPIANSISQPFIRAFNAISDAWNSTVGGLNFKVPDWVPGMGGKTFQVNRMPRYANGTLSAQGGMAVVGERGAEIVSLPRGSRVTPNSEIGRELGGGNVSINVNVGMYAGSEMEKRKVAEALFEALKDVAGAKNTTVGKMMGV